MAERLASGYERVLFVATAEGRDKEMQHRIKTHREQRPPSWETLEEPRNLEEALRPRLQQYEVILLDCITMWVSNLLLNQSDTHYAEGRVLATAHSLLEMIESSMAMWILVSNEVGLGLVPSSPLGRVYRDTLGRVNQMIASRANRVTFMVAGLPLDLP
jgi:adenosylcobinamide kinase/adenosylcobinamide-phosphate guanylyltransferase